MMGDWFGFRFVLGLVTDRRYTHLIIGYLVASATLIVGAAYLVFLLFSGDEPSESFQRRAYAWKLLYGLIAVVVVAFGAIHGIAKYVESKLNLPKPWEE